MTMWPWTWPFNPKTTPFLEYPKVIPYTKFEHFGIIRFFQLYSGQTDKQTNKTVTLGINMMQS